MATDDDNDPLRDGKGRFTRSIDTARRDAEAARLRAKPHRLTYQQIADQLDYADKGQAWRGVRAAMADVAREPVTQLIATEAAELDQLYAAALDILDHQHPMISHGKIVRDDNDQPLPDDGPRLTALARAQAIRESYRKLYGADAPKQLSVALDQRLDLEAQTVADALTAALDALDLTNEQRTSALEAAQAKLLETAPESDT